MVSIPASLIATIGIYLMGYTLNLMSLLDRRSL
jgi:multidrug efflux pump subunit AcrB